MISTRVTTQPVLTPLTEEQARRWVRLSPDETAADVLDMVKGTVGICERETEHALITRTCEARLDGFWGGYQLTLAWPPLQAVTGITYYDSSGVLQTLAADVYVVDTHRRPGRIYLAYGKSWPSTRCVPDAVRVVYTAGFGLDDSAVPSEFRHPLRLLLANYDLNRSPVVTGTIATELPLGLRHCLNGLWIPDASETRVEALAA